MSTEVKRGFFKMQTATATLIVDTRLFPIVPASWHGESTPQLYDLLWQFRDEHLVDRVSKAVFVHIIDDMKPPSATTRKYLAEKSKVDPRLQMPNVEFMVVAVVSNPLLRGFLTAITWLTGKDTMPLEYDADLPKAIRRATKILDAAGVPYSDVNPDNYTFPERQTLTASDFVATYS